jgi:glucose/arabinose dehydrogenase
MPEYRADCALRRRSIPLAALLVGAACAAADTGYQIETIADGLDHPWSLAFLPDGRILVTERPGRLRVIEDGVLHPDPVAGVPPVVAGGQGGLFEVLPDADFATNSRIYLSLAHGSPSANATRLVSATLTDGRLADLSVIFTAMPAKATPLHYGGRIVQLPDRTLVLAVGDGYDYRERAQALDDHLGTLVRVRPDGSVPGDNPFIDTPGARPEIYSHGHRNPQGLAWYPAHGALYAHEHGPRGGDELNRILPGGNYGWPVATHGVDYTGARISPYTQWPGMETPLLHWTPSIAPAGLALYEGGLFPHWQGDLLVAALADRSVHRLRLRPDGIEAAGVLFRELGERIRDVRSGPDGAVWLLTDSSSGRILRVTPAEAAASMQR